MVKSVGNANFEEMADIYHEVTARVLGQNNCNRVDLVFEPVTLTVYQRNCTSKGRRGIFYGDNDSTPEYASSKQWRRFMSNPKNKQNLANFLSHSLSVLCKRELQPHQQVV